MEDWKIIARGTLVHKDTLEIYEYIHYKHGNSFPEPFLTAIPFSQAVDDEQKTKFSVPIDIGVLYGDGNYKVYPNQKPQEVKLLLEAENLINNIFN